MMHECGLGFSDFHCAPSNAARHGSGAGQFTGPTDTVASSIHAHFSATADGRSPLFPLLTALLSLIAGMSADSKLSQYPGNAPLAQDALEWIRVNKPRLSTDERALADGYTPRSLLGYSLATVPAALTADGDVTAGMVANREVVILAREDENRKLVRQKAAHEADMRNAFFETLADALMPKAPLMLQGLRERHKQGAPFEKYFDGPPAWQELVAKGQTASQLPGESGEHDAFITALELKPLPSKASAQEFAERVSDALTNHVPYMDRPFKDDDALCRFILRQMPAETQTEGRLWRASQPDADRNNSTKVLEGLVKVVALANPVQLKDGVLKEFIGFTTEEGGRRPGKGFGGRGRGDGGRGGRGGRDGGRERPTACSVPPPRGPMCNIPHNGPCWRDNLWAGPLPRRIHNDPTQKAAIDKGRVANGSRLGERVVELAVPPPPQPKAEEGVQMVDEEDHDMAQEWPLAEPDVPPELTQPRPGKASAFTFGPPTVTISAASGPSTSASAEQMAALNKVKLTEIDELQARIAEKDARLAEQQRQLAAAAARSTAAEAALASAVSCHTEEPDVPLGTPARTPAAWADFRVNLTVAADDAARCVSAGGKYDVANGVLYAPARTDLRPLREWLPFDLDSAGSDAPSGGVIPVTSPAPRGAGPIKSDGSPNMSFVANKQMRQLLEPVRSSLSPAPKAKPGLAAPPDASISEATDPQVARAEREVFQLARRVAPFVGVSLLLLAMAAYSVIAGAVTFVFGNASLVRALVPTGGGDVSSVDSWTIAKDFLSRDGNSWCLAAVLGVFGFQFPGILRILVSVARVVIAHVNRSSMTVVLLLFIVQHVARSSGLSTEEAHVVRVHGADSPVIRASLALADAAFVQIDGVVEFSFVPEEELCAILGDDGRGGLTIWDTGSKRHLVTDPAMIVNERPCPFRIRGVVSDAREPDKFGDVWWSLPMEDGSIERVLLSEAVCIKEAPHNVISPGRLENEGICQWNGTYRDGRKILLQNRGFVVMPFCERSRKRHNLSADQQVTLTVEASDAPANQAIPEAKGMIYWFSGIKTGMTGMSGLWKNLTGNVCTMRDSRLGDEHNLLSDRVANVDLAAIRSGKVNRGGFSPPCDTHSVSRHRKHPTLRPLRSDTQVEGLTNLTLVERALVNASNLYTERCCEAMTLLDEHGGLFWFENPVRRNDASGPWKRFNSGRFPNHGSVWQRKCVIDVARRTRARVVHVPMCWFAHEDSEICSMPQKYLSFMYSYRMEPAFAFLHRCRCVHSSHAEQAVGFTGGTAGASLGRIFMEYPEELDRVLARGLAYPDRCASDAAWANGVPPAPVEAALPTIEVQKEPPTEPLAAAPDQVPEARGLPGDRASNNSGAVIATGHKVNMRKLTSRQVHETFSHKPISVLRMLPSCNSDIPAWFADLQELPSPCPDCLAGNATHLGSHSHLPEVTEAGEIIAMDLHFTRTADIFTGGNIQFCAIDLYSDWDFLIKIKYKTEVPECTREVIRVCRSHNVNVKRLHVDGENIFHSDEAHDALKAELNGIGCLLTTGSDYDHRQNSKIERHFRRLGENARPGFLQSGLGDEYYPCALVDASAKHKVLPLARVEGESPHSLFTGKPGTALAHRAFGQLAYVRKEYELNDSRTKLDKAHARGEPGILLAYGVTGVLHDRRVPAWVVHVPTVNRNKPMVSPHVTVVLGCFPGKDGIRDGLHTLLRTRSEALPSAAVNMEVDDDGAVAEVSTSLLPEIEPLAERADAGAAAEPGTEVVGTHHVAHIPVAPTISQRLSRRTNASTSRGAGQPEFNLVIDEVLAVDDSSPMRAVLPATSFHSSASFGEPHGDPTRASLPFGLRPWLSAPWGGDADAAAAAAINGTEEPVMPMDEQLDEMVLFCNDDCDVKDCTMHSLTKRAPRRVVRFPWGDVPSPWVSGYQTVYETGIDDSVFFIEDICTSTEADDDPTWEQAMKSNDAQQFLDAAEVEYCTLERFEVFELHPADSVPGDEDIFDTMLVPKRKRGKDNVVTKHKVRCVICGNQMVESAKRGTSRTTVDLQTHAPGLRHSTLKHGFATCVCLGMRQRDFDVDGAYLQGMYVDRRVFARAPKIYRKYDERGVEYVWLLRRALYGGPDSGRIWYNTYSHYLTREETETPFNRLHYDPSAFSHVCDAIEIVDVSATKGVASLVPGPPRINLMVYVDDGRTFDTCANVCDRFLDRLAVRFSITRDGGGLTFMIGMDISLGDGWIKIYSRTFISGLCGKWLDRAPHEYEPVYTPAHPKLLDIYEAAFQARSTADPSLTTDYRSLVGSLLFPAPITRPECLFAVGVHGRALDFSTPDLMKTALRILVYMGQTMDDGLTYSRHAPNAARLEWWTDSDWAVRRSTTGGTGQLAGASVMAQSRRQDCVTGSSTHAEVVAASSNSNDLLWSRGLCGELGMPQDEATVLWCDAQNVLTISSNFVSSKQTRHISRRELIVRERETEGHLRLEKVASEDNLADIFTKALDRIPFEKLRKLVVNLLFSGVSYLAPRGKRPR